MASPQTRSSATALESSPENMSAARLVFRSSFPVLWRWTSTLCGLMGAVIYLVAWMAGQPISAPPTIGLAIVIASLFAIAAALFPVYVLVEGIRCYNFNGFYRTLGWEEMGKMRVSSVFGLKYLVVQRDPGADEIWIPLYLHDRMGFKAVVKDRAGADHPLTQSLERYS